MRLEVLLLLLPLLPLEHGAPDRPRGHTSARVRRCRRRAPQVASCRATRWGLAPSAPGQCVCVCVCVRARAV
eukprot:15443463-Alexandrium_andersonii.AAC.1